MEKVDAHEAFGKIAGRYGNEYKKVEMEKHYPANYFRLRVIKELLSAINPNKILDIGCGPGDPMLAIKNSGFNIEGFDFSNEMVAEARKLFKNAGYSEDLINKNNMENITGINRGDYDCFMALGSLYYARDFNKTMRGVSDLMVPGNQLIFSLRNELFSLFSLNKYSANFFYNFLSPTQDMSPDLKAKYQKFLTEKFPAENIDKVFQTVDDRNIHSETHNPLTVQKEVLEPYGLKLNNIYYYHFHALPPVFEHSDTLDFRKSSAEMENNPTDWRGMFLCSSFIVHAEKN